MKCHTISRVVVFVLLVSAMVIRGYGQQAQISLPYTRYTVADGLAQMQIRHIYADHDGLIWIGTQGGLSVFVGNVMHTFSKTDALAEQYIMTLTRGTNQLYISTLHGSYTFDGLTLTPMGDGTNWPPSHVLFEDPLHTVWFKDNENRLVTYIYKNGAFAPAKEIYPAIGHLTIQRAWGDPEWKKCYILDFSNRFYVFDPYTGELQTDSLTFSPSLKISLSWNVSSDPDQVIFYVWGNYALQDERVTDIYRLSGDTLQHVATRNACDGLLHSLSIDAPMGYVGHLNGFSTLFLRTDSVYRPQQMLKFGYIRFLVEAHHKMYLGTDDGFVVMHGDGLENFEFPECDYAWSVVPGSTHELFLGCYRSGIYKLSTDGHLLMHYGLPDAAHGARPGEQVLSNTLSAPEGIFWGSNGGFIFMNNQGTELRHIRSWRSIESMAYDPVNTSVVAGSDKLLWFAPNLLSITDSIALDEKLLAGGFINDLAFSSDGQLWIAAPGGIEQLSADRSDVQLFTSQDHTLPCKGGVTLDYDPEGNLWCGATCGLMLLRKGDESFERVLPDIITQRVNQVSIVPGQRLVCASNNTLYLLDRSGHEPTVLAMYNRKNGLNLNEPSENGSALTDGRYVWLPSVSGIQRLDLHRVPDDVDTAKLVLLQINNTPVRFLTDTAAVPMVKGSAALLNLILIDHSGKNWQYQVGLNQGDFSPWQSSPELLLSGLHHGRNQAEIRASWNPADPETYIKLPVTLSVSLPLLQRHQIQRGLMALAFILIGLVVLFLIYARRNAGKAERLKGDLYRNRLKTIQVYLNPHFLFNTLSSIQDRVLHQDAREGNDMIVRLARVFRKVLDNGKIDEGKIPLTRLSEEIALIEDIVYLNNKQLNRPVRFSLSLDPDLTATNPLIPPMLIQPFVENAFKHAFNDTDEDKTVVVTIKRDQDNLIISIIDNGVGYGAAAQHRSSSSLGLQLAEERMNILNKLNIPNSITIKEVQPHGTLVWIKIKLIA